MIKNDKKNEINQLNLYLVVTTSRVTNHARALAWESHARLPSSSLLFSPLLSSFFYPLLSSSLLRLSSTSLFYLLLRLLLVSPFVLFHLRKLCAGVRTLFSLCLCLLY